MPWATILASQRIGAPASKAARASLLQIQARSRHPPTMSTMPQAWMMRTTALFLDAVRKRDKVGLGSDDGEGAAVNLGAVANILPKFRHKGPLRSLNKVRRFDQRFAPLTLSLSLRERGRRSNGCGRTPSPHPASACGCGRSIMASSPRRACAGEGGGSEGLCRILLRVGRACKGSHAMRSNSCCTALRRGLHSPRLKASSIRRAIASAAAGLASCIALAKASSPNKASWVASNRWLGRRRPPRRMQTGHRRPGRFRRRRYGRARACPPSSADW